MQEIFQASVGPVFTLSSLWRGSSYGYTKLCRQRMQLVIGPQK